MPELYCGCGLCPYVPLPVLFCKWHCYYSPLPLHPSEPESVSVYEHPPPKYSAEAILKILLDPNIDKSKICTTRPTVIKRSSTFVVNVTKLGHPDDIKCDNFGVWSHSGSHPVVFKVHMENGYVEAETLLGLQVVM